ncbi:MAG: MAG1210 family protein [Anaeroplasmataceae bacterium]
MKDDSILDPFDKYKGQFKEAFHENAIKYFDELVKTSGVDVFENKSTVKKYKNELTQAKYWEKKENSIRGVKIFLIVCSILLLLAGIFFIYKGVINDGQIHRVLCFILGPVGVVLAIIIFVAIKKKVDKVINSRKEKKEKHIEESNKLLNTCWEQMSSLNASYDWNIPAKLINKVTPLIQIDDVFDPDKYEYLHEKYNLNEITESNKSVNYVQSGSIVGNPFVLLNTYNQNMVNHTYTGSLVIHWTTIERDSKGGTRTVHHSQTLVASLIKPVPNYYYQTELIYGCEAGPNLSFGHEPMYIKNKNDKQIEKIVKKGTKELSKKEKKATEKGGDFTMMANNEFDVLFNGDDRDNEVEFRLLFTPLAQTNMLKLLKSKEPYGDDFYFYKRKCLNYIMSEHSQNIDYHSDPSKFINFDVEDAKAKFLAYNEEFFKGLYFDLAPLLSIPMYQQLKTREYIYKTPYRANITSFEQESLANRFDKNILKHNESATDIIVKARFDHKVSNADIVNIEAYSFKTIEHVDFVPTHGGDGRIHNVPVKWYEYVPIVKTTPMQIQKTNSNLKEYNEQKNSNQFLQFMSQYSKNNAIIYERGLMSMLLGASPSNEALNKLQEIFNKKGGEE